ncbi:hypothetical protein MKX03_035736 [Papaver bracteatum]|nr:hypothetical protein MKX03_035736 [Papaver bracteatum]
MEKSRNLMIGFVFIYILFASSTLMCTSQDTGELQEPADTTNDTCSLAGTVRTGKSVVFAKCIIDEVCHELCSGLTNTVGKTEKGKSGVCVENGIYCACCRVAPE